MPVGGADIPRWQVDVDVKKIACGRRKVVGFFLGRQTMNFTFLRAVGAAASLALVSTSAMAAVISLKCTLTQREKRFPLYLKIWIHPRVSSADVQRYLTGGVVGWDPAPLQHSVHIATGYYDVDLGNGGMRIFINRMTGIGEFDGTAEIAYYKCVKNKEPLPKGKF